MDVRGVVCSDSFRRDFLSGSGITVISNESRNDDEILRTVEEHGIDALISVQHIWFLPSSVLDAVGGKAYNLHNARLPEYKGYNTITHAILNGESEYWTSIQEMTAEVDGGDVLYDRSVLIYPGDSVLDVYLRVLPAAVANFADLVCGLQSGQKFQRRRLEHEGYFYRKSDAEREFLRQDLSDELKRRAFYFPGVLQICGKR